MVISAVAVVPSESETLTVSTYVPATVLAATVTTPPDVIEISVTLGAIVNVSAPVPPETVNALEESARPAVVRIFVEPPAITIGWLTVILMGTSV